MKFAEFQNSEPHIEGLVDGNHHTLQIESHKVIVEDPVALTMWCVRELFNLFSVGEESDIGVLGLVFTCFALDRVDHEFEELFFHLRLAGGTEIRVLRAVRLEPE